MAQFLCRIKCVRVCFLQAIFNISIMTYPYTLYIQYKYLYYMTHSFIWLYIPWVGTIERAAWEDMLAKSEVFMVGKPVGGSWMDERPAMGNCVYI